MLEFSIHRCNGFSRKGLRDRCVTNVALIPDLLAVAAEMLSVMTTKAPLGIVVADVVRMRLPIGLHLRKEICLVDRSGTG